MIECIKLAFRSLVTGKCNIAFRFQKNNIFSLVSITLCLSVYYSSAVEKIGGLHHIMCENIGAWATRYF